MPDRPLAERLHELATHALEQAQLWMRNARNKREKEFAGTAMRHARGLQVAAAAGQQEERLNT